MQRCVGGIKKIQVETLKPLDTAFQNKPSRSPDAWSLTCVLSLCWTHNFLVLVLVLVLRTMKKPLLLSLLLFPFLIHKELEIAVSRFLYKYFKEKYPVETSVFKTSRAPLSAQN